MTMLEGEWAVWDSPLSNSGASVLRYMYIDCLDEVGLS